MRCRNRPGHGYPEPTEQRATVAHAQSTMLPKKPKRSKPWFEQSADHLRKVMANTHAAFAAHKIERSVVSRQALKDARAVEVEAMTEARSAWVMKKCGIVDEGHHHQFLTTKAAWKAMRELEAGLGASFSEGNASRLRKFGSKTELCNTDEEEAESRGEHFSNLLARAAKYDPEVVDLLWQREIKVELDGDITEEEIDIAVRKLNATGPGMTGAHATAIKALWSEEFSSGDESETARKLLIDCVQSVWECN